MGAASLFSFHKIQQVKGVIILFKRMSMTNIQIVDDDMNTLNALKRLLNRENWRVDTFSSITAALSALDDNEYNVIIADYRMPLLDGVGYLAWAKQKSPGSTRLMLSAFSDNNALIAAINSAEVYRFIAKPWNNDELIEIVRQASLRSTRANLAREHNAKHPLIVDSAVQELERHDPGITLIQFDADGAISLDTKLSDIF
jgi:DNA-binding NtrC family response regulator